MMVAGGKAVNVFARNARDSASLRLLRKIGRARKPSSLSAAVSVRITETDLSNRDISGAKKSFSELTEFLTRFPDSQYASYAKQRNIYLRNMIARNELAAADYYQSIDAHVAAVRRAKYVIENIPNSS